MVSLRGVLLVSKEPETIQAVSDTLRTNGEIPLVGVCTDLLDLVTHLQKERTAAVLVDIDPQPDEILKELHQVVERFRDIRFVVLAETFRNELLFESMEMGVRYFLLKESIATDLAGILQRLIGAGPLPSSWGGLVTTTLSAGGGCGSTTVAVNLANELGLVTSKPSLLVDMDSAYGTVATYLGLDGRYGIADVLIRNNSIDPALISSSALSYSDGLHVLISPASVDLTMPRPLQYENLPGALEACRQVYGHTIIDAPRVSIDVAAALAKASAITLIVFQLQVKDIRLVRAIVSALEQHGVPTETILPLANRYRKRNPMISLAEGREALGGMAIEYISNDYRSALRGVNYGQPLAQAAPRSSLRKDLRRLAVRISRMQQPRQKTQEQT